MDPGALIPIALVLACPLLMIFMHRRGHGAHHAHHRDHFNGTGDDVPEVGSVAELRRRRDELEAEITRLEAEQPEAANHSSPDVGTPAVP